MFCFVTKMFPFMLFIITLGIFAIMFQLAFAMLLLDRRLVYTLHLISYFFVPYASGAFVMIWYIYEHCVMCTKMLQFYLLDLKVFSCLYRILLTQSAWSTFSNTVKFRYKAPPSQVSSLNDRRKISSVYSSTKCLCMEYRLSFTACLS